MVHEVEHHLHVGGRRVDPDPDAVHGGEVVGKEVQHELVHLERTVNGRLSVKYLKSENILHLFVVVTGPRSYCFQQQSWKTVKVSIY